MLLQEYCLVVGTLYIVNAEIEREFPRDFLFGAASSAYQVEGAWNISDKGESIWDRYTHTRSDLIVGGSNGDIAADSYHKYKEDIRLLKHIGANTYRFSLAWSRILPDGFSNRISKSGVKYYNSLINECIANDITPMVTIYHWDLPQRFQDLGGWANPGILLWIEDYAEIAFRLFGDRVKIWSTVNEPFMVCSVGYGSTTYAPGLNDSGIADYLCGHHILLANARIHALYDRKFRSEQKGKVGIVLNCGWFQPADITSVENVEAAEKAFDFRILTLYGKVGIVLNCGWFQPADVTSVANVEATEKAFDFGISTLYGKVGIVLNCGWFQPADITSAANVEAAERAFEFGVGWFAHPLFTAEGDYPEVMKTRISEKSKQQGYKRSRLPEFTSEQIEDLRYRSDYIGINFYTASSVRDQSYDDMGFMDDAGYKYVNDSSWKGISWTKNTPWALGKLLKTMTMRYQLPEIYITENGYTDFGGLQDRERVIYHHDHLQELVKIIRGGIDVKGYIVWSLTDNFQWNEGYVNCFGLFEVDFNRADRPRTPKLSAKFITEVYSTGRVPNLSNYIHFD